MRKSTLAGIVGMALGAVAAGCAYQIATSDNSYNRDRYSRRPETREEALERVFARYKTQDDVAKAFWGLQREARDNPDFELK